jgi:hypothetical protein
MVRQLPPTRTHCPVTIPLVNSARPAGSPPCHYHLTDPRTGTVYRPWDLGGLNNVPDFRFVDGFHINPTGNPARSGNPAH